MQVKVDFSEYKPWAGAVSTYNDIVKRVGLEELESALEGIFEGEDPEDVQINDLLWFEPEIIYDALGISDDEEEDDEEEEDSED